MPSDDDIKTAVTTALGIRHATTSPEEFDTVAQLVRGQLHAAIGDLPLGQVAQKITDLFLDGRKDTPPDGHRPQLRELVRSACTTLHVPVPSDGVTEALVNVAIGWMIDHSLPTPPGGRAVVMHNVVGLYLAGAS